MGLNPDFDQRVIGWVNGLKAQARAGVHPPQEFVALDHLLHDMRLYKSSAELGADAPRRQDRRRGPQARHARSPARATWNTRSMAELLHEFRRNDADISYQPIVGGGANAASCTTARTTRS